MIPDLYLQLEFAAVALVGFVCFILLKIRFCVWLRFSRKLFHEVRVISRHGFVPVW